MGCLSVELRRTAVESLELSCWGLLAFLSVALEDSHAPPSSSRHESVLRLILDPRVQRIPAMVVGGSVRLLFAVETRIPKS